MVGHLHKTQGIHLQRRGSVLGQQPVESLRAQSSHHRKRLADYGTGIQHEMQHQFENQHRAPVAITRRPDWQVYQIYRIADTGHRVPALLSSPAPPFHHHFQWSQQFFPVL